MAGVALIYPGTGWDVRRVTTLPPLSVLCVARPLVELGVEVRVIDQRVEPDWRLRLREFLAGGAVCVGVSAMTGNQITGGLEAAALVRETAPGTPIVWGGVHPSLLPGQTLAHPLVDIVVLGEGENSFAALVRALERGAGLESVPGIAFLDASGRVIQTEPAPPVDLDAVTDLPYELVGTEPYVTSQTLGLRDVGMITSRGCPHRCSYCYNIPYNNRGWRGQSAAPAAAAMVSTAARFGVDAVVLKDDNFFADINRALEIAGLLRESGANLTVRAECRADYVARRLDADALEFLREAGFREFTVGVESGTDRGLERLCKDITVDDVVRANLKLKAAGIPTKYTFMAGFPWETESDRRATLELMLRLIGDNPQARTTPVHLFTPYPGTAAFDEAVEAGFEPPSGLEAWAAMGFHEIGHPWLSPALRRRLERVSLSTYFLDGKTIREYFGGRRLIQRLVGAYGALVRLRARLNWFGFMPELRLLDRVRRARTRGR